MELLVRHTPSLSGEVQPPGSKSQSIRALFFALLGQGESMLHHLLVSEDVQAAMRVCMQLGAQVSGSSERLIVSSQGVPIPASPSILDTGDSGLTTHIVLPLLGLRQHAQVPVVLTCGEQMRARPIAPLMDAVRTLGLTLHALDAPGKLPVSVTGALTGGKVTISGMSSQYLSALLMALPCAPTDSEITVYDLQSRPYVDMTLNWLFNQRIVYHHEASLGKDVYHLPGRQRYRAFQVGISGDFSSASYLIAAAALIPGQVYIKGLDLNDLQGDRYLVQLLQDMGARIEVRSTGLMITGGKPLRGMLIDANAIPDLLPILAVVGTMASGHTTLRNVQHARLKETDRIYSMTQGLRALGATVEEQPEGMTIYQSPLQGARVKGYGDHRTVMALAVAGMLAAGHTEIEDGQAICKTYPTFVEHMQSLGSRMEQRDHMDSI